VRPRSPDLPPTGRQHLLDGFGLWLVWHRDELDLVERFDRLDRRPDLLVEQLGNPLEQLQRLGEHHRLEQHEWGLELLDGELQQHLRGDELQLLVREHAVHVWRRHVFVLIVIVIVIVVLVFVFVFVLLVEQRDGQLVVLVLQFDVQRLDRRIEQLVRLNRRRRAGRGGLRLHRDLGGPGVAAAWRGGRGRVRVRRGHACGGVVARRRGERRPVCGLLPRAGPVRVGRQHRSPDARAGGAKCQRDDLRTGFESRHREDLQLRHVARWPLRDG
jgi:hypothetical protein